MWNDQCPTQISTKYSLLSDEGCGRIKGVKIGEQRLEILKQEQKNWMIGFMKALIEHYGGSYSLSDENAFQILDSKGSLVISIGFRIGSKDILYVLGNGYGDKSGKVRELGDLKRFFPNIFGGAK